MKLFNRPVHISLSPNLEFNDFITALRLLIQPWKWIQGEGVEKVENWFRNYFGVETAVSFNAGRSALFAVLKCLELPKGAEVLTQAFTCVAVPNSILWANLTPVYVDIDDSLNIDLKDAKKKLTSNTKALIVQHTFGVPADLEKIHVFCKKHKLVLIENCAHALGARYKGKPVGTFGDVAIFSFGRDKIISSVCGGMAITNNKRLSTKLVQFLKEQKKSSVWWVLQQLIHPLITFVSLYTYQWWHLGKGILWTAQKLHLLSWPVSKPEKRGQKPDCFPRAFPNALAELLLYQLAELDKRTQIRKSAAHEYFAKLAKLPLTLPVNYEEAVYLRFNLITKRADEIRFSAKKRGIVVGNWYGHVIDPKGVELHKIGYVLGSCPVSERIAGRCVNLPTFPRLTKYQLTQLQSDFRHI